MDFVHKDFKTIVLNTLTELKENMDKKTKRMRETTYEQKDYP